MAENLSFVHVRGYTRVPRASSDRLFAWDVAVVTSTQSYTLLGYSASRDLKEGCRFSFHN